MLYNKYAVTFRCIKQTNKAICKCFFKQKINVTINKILELILNGSGYHIKEAVRDYKSYFVLFLKVSIVWLDKTNCIDLYKPSLTKHKHDSLFRY